MKVVFCSMIFLCSVPANATWDFSWESTKSYIPSIPSIELSSISLKPYLGWIFGTTCLLASMVGIALIKNNTKSEILQARRDAIVGYEVALSARAHLHMHRDDKQIIDSINIQGFSFDCKEGITEFLCTAPKINQFNMNISDAQKNEYSFLKVLRQNKWFTECVIDRIIFDHSSCRTKYKLSVRFDNDGTYYRFKQGLSIDQLIANGTLELANK